MAGEPHLPPLAARRVLPVLLTLLASHAVQACVHAAREVPALLVEPTEAARAELLRAVSDALNGAAPTLADDALTRDSTLVIERVHPRDARGLPLSGRDRGRPEQFRLVKDGARCVLVHVASGRRFTLASATCAPRP